MQRLVVFYLCVPLAAMSAMAAETLPDEWIAYTEFQTNLSGGRHANVITKRAAVIRADGSERRVLAAELVKESNTWTQFAGWSPDGTIAIIGRGWESPENAAWEEAHKRFRFTAEGWLYDQFLLDMKSGSLTNVTAVDRVSYYNSGVFFWPGDETKLGFQALIDGVSHPFSMDRDGRNKTDLATSADGFTYGFHSSPNGKLVSYHKAYQIYIAQADGARPLHVETGAPFNFAPVWSPDGRWLAFVSGEHYNCHPHIVRADGSGLRKIGDRAGFRGVIEFLDVFDFHGGSSDTVKWSPDGWIYYSKKIGDSIELMRVNLDDREERMTRSAPGSANYHPQPTASGRWVVFGSRRAGVRNLYVLDAKSGQEHRVTDLRLGRGAMWAHWQPGGGDRDGSRGGDRDRGGD